MVNSGSFDATGSEGESVKSEFTQLEEDAAEASFTAVVPETAQIDVEINTEKSTKTSLQCSVPLDKVKNVLDICSSKPKFNNLFILENYLQKKNEEEVNKPTVKRLLCLFCDRTFTSNNLKQKHVDRCHSSGQTRRSSSRTSSQNQSTTACCFCSKLNSTDHTLKELLEHLIDEHSNRYNACLSCQERFSSLSSLREHNKSIHGLQEPVESKTSSPTPVSTEISSENSSGLSSVSPTSDIVRPELTKTYTTTKSDILPETSIENTSPPKSSTPKPIKRTSSLKTTPEIQETSPEEPTGFQEDFEDAIQVNVISPEEARKLKPPEVDDEDIVLSKRVKNSATKTKKKSHIVSSKKISVKSTKNGLRNNLRTTRASVKQISSFNKQRKNKIDKNEATKVSKKVSNPSSVFSLVNAYIYKYEKIYDHASDSIKDANSVQFNAVFDKEFYSRTVSNIRDNLLHHLDGKLNRNIESENRISNFVSDSELKSSNDSVDNFGCDLSLNAVTPVATLLGSSQYGEDFDAQIEYGAKASQKKAKKVTVVKYKFPNKKYNSLFHKNDSQSDLTCLDMWTQLSVKRRQHKFNVDHFTEDFLNYQRPTGESKRQVEELNKILDGRGPFEDLRLEANAARFVELRKKSAKEGDYISEEASNDVYFVLEDLLTRVMCKVSEKTEPEIEDIKEEIQLPEEELILPNYLQLQRSSSSNEIHIDQTDSIALICSSQDEEEMKKNKRLELSGEWARPRIYICATCGQKMPNYKSLEDHKNGTHPHIWGSHYEFVGNQSQIYRNLSIPGLGKVGCVELLPLNRQWQRSDARVCSKCTKHCHNLGELHKHILECGGDWTWMLARKKCKYRPYGARTRRRRQRGYKRSCNPEVTRTRELKPKIKPIFIGPRPKPSKPSDAETIERMLANLPPKRNRKMISMRDGVQRPRNKLINQSSSSSKSNKNNHFKSSSSQNLKQSIRNALKRKITANSLRKQNKHDSDSDTPISLRTRVTKKEKEIPDSSEDISDITKQLMNKRTKLRNTRMISRILGSKIFDNNSALITRRKIAKAIAQNNIIRKTRLRSKMNSQQPKTDPKEDEIVDETENKLTKNKTLVENEKKTVKAKNSNDDNDSKLNKNEESSKNNEPDSKPIKKSNTKRLLSVLAKTNKKPKPIEIDKNKPDTINAIIDQVIGMAVRNELFKDKLDNVEKADDKKLDKKPGGKTIRRTRSASSLLKTDPNKKKEENDPNKKKEENDLNKKKEENTKNLEEVKDKESDIKTEKITKKKKTLMQNVKSFRKSFKKGNKDKGEEKTEGIKSKLIRTLSMRGSRKKKAAITNPETSKITVSQEIDLKKTTTDVVNQPETENKIETNSKPCDCEEADSVKNSDPVVMPILEKIEPLPVNNSSDLVPILSPENPIPNLTKSDSNICSESDKNSDKMITNSTVNKLKSKMKRSGRGLNDCIAMLRCKLEQKITSNEPSLVDKSNLFILNSTEVINHSQPTVQDIGKTEIKETDAVIKSIPKEEATNKTEIKPDKNEINKVNVLEIPSIKLPPKNDQISEMATVETQTQTNDEDIVSNSTDYIPTNLQTNFQLGYILNATLQNCLMECVKNKCETFKIENQNYPLTQKVATKIGSVRKRPTVRKSKTVSTESEGKHIPNIPVLLNTAFIEKPREKPNPKSNKISPKAASDTSDDDVPLSKLVTNSPCTKLKVKPPVAKKKRNTKKKIAFTPLILNNQDSCIPQISLQERIEQRISLENSVQNEVTAEKPANTENSNLLNNADTNNKNISLVNNDATIKETEVNIETSANNDVVPEQIENTENENIPVDLSVKNIVSTEEKSLDLTPQNTEEPQKLNTDEIDKNNDEPMSSFNSEKLDTESNNKEVMSTSTTDIKTCTKHEEINNEARKNTFILSETCKEPLLTAETTTSKEPFTSEEICKEKVTSETYQEPVTATETSNEQSTSEEICKDSLTSTKVCEKPFTTTETNYLTAEETCKEPLAVKESSETKQAVEELFTPKEGVETFQPLSQQVMAVEDEPLESFLINKTLTEANIKSPSSVHSSENIDIISKINHLDSGKENSECVVKKPKRVGRKQKTKRKRNEGKANNVQTEICEPLAENLVVPSLGEIQNESEETVDEISSDNTVQNKEDIEEPIPTEITVTNSIEDTVVTNLDQEQDRLDTDAVTEDMTKNEEEIVDEKPKRKRNVSQPISEKEEIGQNIETKSDDTNIDISANPLPASSDLDKSCINDTPAKEINVSVLEDTPSKEIKVKQKSRRRNVSKENLATEPNIPDSDISVNSSLEKPIENEKASKQRSRKKRSTSKPNIFEADNNLNEVNKSDNVINKPLEEKPNERFRKQRNSSKLTNSDLETANKLEINELLVETSEVKQKSRRKRNTAKSAQSKTDMDNSLLNVSPSSLNQTQKDLEQKPLVEESTPDMSKNKLKSRRKRSVVKSFNAEKGSSNLDTTIYNVSIGLITYKTTESTEISQSKEVSEVNPSELNQSTEMNKREVSESDQSEMDKSTEILENNQLQNISKISDVPENEEKSKDRTVSESLNTELDDNISKNDISASSNSDQSELKESTTSDVASEEISQKKDISTSEIATEEICRKENIPTSDVATEEISQKEDISTSDITTEEITQKENLLSEEITQKENVLTEEIPQKEDKTTEEITGNGDESNTRKSKRKRSKVSYIEQEENTSNTDISENSKLEQSTEKSEINILNEDASLTKHKSRKKRSVSKSKAVVEAENSEEKSEANLPSSEEIDTSTTKTRRKRSVSQKGNKTQNSNSKNSEIANLDQQVDEEKSASELSKTDLEANKPKSRRKRSVVNKPTDSEIPTSELSENLAETSENNSNILSETPHIKLQLSSKKEDESNKNGVKKKRGRSKKRTEISESTTRANLNEPTDKTKNNDDSPLDDASENLIETFNEIVPNIKLKLSSNNEAEICNKELESKTANFGIEFDSVDKTNQISLNIDSDTLKIQAISDEVETNEAMTRKKRKSKDVDKEKTESISDLSDTIQTAEDTELDISNNATSEIQQNPCEEHITLKLTLNKDGDKFKRKRKIKIIESELSNFIIDPSKTETADTSVNIEVVNEKIEKPKKRRNTKNITEPEITNLISDQRQLTEENFDKSGNTDIENTESGVVNEQILIEKPKKKRGRKKKISKEETSELVDLNQTIISDTFSNIENENIVEKSTESDITDSNINLNEIVQNGEKDSPLDTQKIELTEIVTEKPKKKRGRKKKTLETEQIVDSFVNSESNKSLEIDNTIEESLAFDENKTDSITVEKIPENLDNISLNTEKILEDSGKITFDVPATDKFEILTSEMTETRTEGKVANLIIKLPLNMDMGSIKEKIKRKRRNRTSNIESETIDPIVEICSSSNTNETMDESQNLALTENNQSESREEVKKSKKKRDKSKSNLKTTENNEIIDDASIASNLDQTTQNITAVINEETEGNNLDVEKSKRKRSKANIFDNTISDLDQTLDKFKKPHNKSKNKTNETQITDTVSDISLNSDTEQTEKSEEETNISDTTFDISDLDLILDDFEKSKRTQEKTQINESMSDISINSDSDQVLDQVIDISPTKKRGRKKINYSETILDDTVSDNFEKLEKKRNKKKTNIFETIQTSDLSDISVHSKLNQSVVILEKLDKKYELNKELDLETVNIVSTVGTSSNKNQPVEDLTAILTDEIKNSGEIETKMEKPKLKRGRKKKICSNEIVTETMVEPITETENVDNIQATLDESNATEILETTLNTEKSIASETENLSEELVEKVDNSFNSSVEEFVEPIKQKPKRKRRSWIELFQLENITATPDLVNLTEKSSDVDTISAVIEEVISNYAEISVASPLEVPEQKPKKKRGRKKKVIEEIIKPATELTELEKVDETIDDLCNISTEKEPENIIDNFKSQIQFTIDNEPEAALMENKDIQNLPKISIKIKQLKPVTEKNVISDSEDELPLVFLKNNKPQESELPVIEEDQNISFGETELDEDIEKEIEQSLEINKIIEDVISNNEERSPDNIENICEDNLIDINVADIDNIANLEDTSFFEDNETTRENSQSIKFSEIRIESLETPLDTLNYLEATIDDSGNIAPEDISRSNNEDQQEEEPTPIEPEENRTPVNKENESSFITTPDLNDTSLRIKIRTNLKIKIRKPKKPRSRVIPKSLSKYNVKRKEKEDQQLRIGYFYCDICNKSFKRKENLTSHKRTLTHIAKLSEIEARETSVKLNDENNEYEAEEESENVFEDMKLDIEEYNIVKAEHTDKIKIKKDSNHKETPEINKIDSIEKEILEETINKQYELTDLNNEDILNKETLINEKEISEIEDDSSENLICESEIQPIEEILVKPQSNLLPNLSNNKTNLKLVDIISEVLDKPVTDLNIGQIDYLPQSISKSSNNCDSNEKYSEPKRYKSLGERKSFDSETFIQTKSNQEIKENYNASLGSVNNGLLSKQLSLLENIIEETSPNLNYIDDSISLSSNQFEEPVEQNISEKDLFKPDYSKLNDPQIKFSHTSNLLSNFIKPNFNNFGNISPTFAKSTKHDENPQRNYEEEKEIKSKENSKRKILNRDEELFLECCSLLKSGSEIPAVSKKTRNIPLNNFSRSNDASWIIQKPPNSDQFIQRDSYSWLAQSSRVDTPIGEPFVSNDWSNSNSAVSSEWLAQKAPSPDRPTENNTLLKKSNNNSGETTYSDIQFEDISIDTSLETSKTLMAIDNSNTENIPLDFNHVDFSGKNVSVRSEEELLQDTTYINKEEESELILETQENKDEAELKIDEDEPNKEFDSDLKKRVVSAFGGLMAKALTNRLQAVVRRGKKAKGKRDFASAIQASITDYAVPVKKNKLASIDSDSSDYPKKLVTKGAMKIFEGGLKVSIPTQDLDLKDVLNCKPKNGEIAEVVVETAKNIDLKEDAIEETSKNGKLKNLFSRFGNKLGLRETKKKAAKHRNKSKNNKKSHDVYEFEESVDSNFMFKERFSLFRKEQHSEKNSTETNKFNEEDKTKPSQESSIKWNGNESDSDTDRYYDSMSFEEMSLSSESAHESNLNKAKQISKKNSDKSKETQKKCVIMGRIFKNASKPKLEDKIPEIRDISSEENSKLVENYLDSCSSVDNTEKVNQQEVATPSNVTVVANSANKMSKIEMDLLFDKLLQEEKKHTENNMSPPILIEKGKNKDTMNEMLPPPTDKSIIDKKKLKEKSKIAGKIKKRQRHNSGDSTSSDEFTLTGKSSKSSKKHHKTQRKTTKPKKDTVFNLEQEMKECIGVAGRKSQRKCTSGKQNVLVESWSSDESSFEDVIKMLTKENEPLAPKENNSEEVEEQTLTEETETPETSNTNSNQSLLPTAEIIETPKSSLDIYEFESDVEPKQDLLKIKIKLNDPNLKQDNEFIATSKIKIPKKTRRMSKSKKHSKSHGEESDETEFEAEKARRREQKRKKCLENSEENPDCLAVTRKKRNAGDQLYYWSSSSEDEFQDLIEVKPIREDTDDDRPMQHGWIVGDSPKKLVTMLAQAKGKKVEGESVKEQGKKNRVTL